MGLILAGGMVVADVVVAEVSASVVDSNMTSAAVVVSGLASIIVCAAVVVTARKPKLEVPYVLVENDRLALALLGTNFYGHPAKEMTMIANVPVSANGFLPKASSRLRPTTAPGMM